MGLCSFRFNLVFLARFDQLTGTMTELIRIVGNTNATVEELRKDGAELKKDVAEIKITLKEHSEKLDYALKTKKSQASALRLFFSPLGRFQSKL
ncbi:hypothetical protein [Carboxydothermus hydrogenoformans]|uniref:hypothetical protein n=1 Tax=Carboxydothermus hydrogenoformans TaxID=129958 RepID=UPI0005A02071|nr:hypothetical protein [Carboxydothermus hydrogenoformans]